jgi:hypothetical protein
VNPEKLEEGKRKLERYRKTTVRREPQPFLIVIILAITASFFS